MARLNIDPNQNIPCTDYFEPEQWIYFQDKLNTVGRIFNAYCRKYGFKLIHDSRWPTRGIFLRKWLVETRIRVILNARYIDNTNDEYGKEFYELYVSRHHLIVPEKFKCKTRFKCLHRYNAEQINNNELLIAEIEPLAIKMAENSKALL